MRTVVKDNGDTLKFAYDGSGNRILKQVKAGDSIITTHYIRDASGNVMATYKNTKLAEQNIFGSSRIGQYHGTTEDGKLKLGLKRYELTNHLGNVMAVITDRINIIPEDESSGDPGGPPGNPNNGDDPFSTNSRILADVVSVNDYYPFGLSMPGRSFSTSSYAYGFNGKRKDDNGEWGSNTHYDYGFRIYNPSIAKFLSVDPLTASYPMLTPYQFSSNTPIMAVDLDGLEAANARAIMEKMIQGVENLEVNNVSDGFGDIQEQHYVVHLSSPNNTANDLKQKIVSDINLIYGTPSGSFRFEEQQVEGEINKGDFLGIRPFPKGFDIFVKVVDVQTFDNNLEGLNGFDHSGFSLKFRTLEGHVEVGVIEFRALEVTTPSGERSFEFSINSTSRINHGIGYGLKNQALLMQEMLKEQFGIRF